MKILFWVLSLAVAGITLVATAGIYKFNIKGDDVFYGPTAVKSSDLLGGWVKDVSVSAKAAQGFYLFDNQQAASINMATLQYTNWSYANGTLTLGWKSIGTGQTLSGDETYKLKILGKKNLYLETEAGRQVYYSRHKVEVTKRAAVISSSLPEDFVAGGIYDLTSDECEGYGGLETEDGNGVVYCDLGTVRNVYACSRDEYLAVIDHTESEIILTRSSGSFEVMKNVQSGSGTKYESKTAMFWTKGDEAMFKAENEDLKCKLA